jgi:ABC-type glycerol-3-phosphate transport system permease component
MAQLDIIEPSVATVLPSLTPAHHESQWVGQRYGRLGRSMGYVGLALCVLLIGLPVYWMTIGAFKSTPEVYRIPPTWFPLAPTLSNFVCAWQSQPFDRY